MNRRVCGVTNAYTYVLSQTCKSESTTDLKTSIGDFFVFNISYILIDTAIK